MPVTRRFAEEPADAERALLVRLIGEVARGDRAAFERLYRRVSPKLYGVCLRILSDAGSAEEALQETFLTIWRQASSFDEARGGAMPWMVSVARSRAIDRFRAARRGAGLPIEAAGDVADDAPSAERALGEASEAVRLHATLDAIAPGDARLIRAAFFEGASYAELAERANMPLGTVKSRIRRALLKVREMLR